MNYRKIYNDLIDRARNRILNDYTESHHIIPRCMGGPDDNKNLIELTAEEHYLAHLLLVKIYPDIPGLVLAARYMCYDNNGRRINNKMFGWIRRKHSEAMSKINSGRVWSPEIIAKRATGQKGRISPMKDKQHSQESKDKISKSLTGFKRPPRTESHIKNHADSIRDISRPQEIKDKISASTKGLSYEDRYGEEKALIKKEKCKQAWIKRKEKLNNISQEDLQP